MEELKTIRDLLLALLDGHEVEEKFEPLNKWETIHNICFETQYLDDEEAVQGRYRITPTKPSIDWSLVPPDFKYLARDEDGLVYVYENKPKKDYIQCWWNVDDGDFAPVTEFKSVKAGDCHWTESLVERPDRAFISDVMHLTQSKAI